MKLQDGAACGYTLQGEDRFISEEEFEADKIGIFFMSPEAWSEIRRNIERQCLKNKNCKESQQRDDMEEFYSKMDSFSVL